jgi:hypothetical protein
MSAWQDGFKVVRCANGRYYSVIAHWDLSCLRYQVGKETKPLPKCGPLAVFDNLADAIGFRLSSSRYKETTIFRCWYTRSRQSYLYITDKHYHFTAVSLPQGTVLATRVIIVEEVHNV